MTLCEHMDYRPAGSSVHGIFQARILEQVSISFFRGSSQPRDRTRISCISCIGRQVLSQLSHQVSSRTNCSGGQILFHLVYLWQGRSKDGFLFMSGFTMKFIKILLITREHMLHVMESENIPGSEPTLRTKPVQIVSLNLYLDSPPCNKTPPFIHMRKDEWKKKKKLYQGRKTNFLIILHFAFSSGNIFKFLNISYTRMTMH